MRHCLDNSPNNSQTGRMSFRNGLYTGKSYTRARRVAHGGTFATRASLAEILVLAGTACASRMAPPTSTRISAMLKHVGSSHALTSAHAPAHPRRPRWPPAHTHEGHAVHTRLHCGDGPQRRLRCCASNRENRGAVVSFLANRGV